MKQQREIYSGRHRAYDQQLARMEQSDISEENKQTILDWHEELFSGRTGKLRVSKLTGQLRKLCELIDWSLRAATKSQVRSLIATINTKKDWSDATKADYRRAVKQFYNYYEEEDPRLRSDDRTERETARELYRYLRKKVTAAYKKPEIDPSQVLTDDDIAYVIENGCRSIKECAFVSVLHESGLRIGEMLNLRVRDLKFFPEYVRLSVDGKTGARQVEIYGPAVGHLAQHLKYHVFRGQGDFEDQCVWIGDCPRRGRVPLKYHGAAAILRKCFERAGYIQRDVVTYTDSEGNQVTKTTKTRHKKPSNCHWFRHSRATIYSTKMTEAVMCKFFGWSIGSKQVRTYTHLNTEQVSDALANIHGVARRANEPTHKRCPCGLANPRGALFCGQCGRPLDTSAALQEREALQEGSKLLGEIMRDPALRAEWQRLLDSHSKCDK